VVFLDLAPSLLAWWGSRFRLHAGPRVLGPQAAPPQQYAFGFRNRMDERYDFRARCAISDTGTSAITCRISSTDALAYLWKMPATVSWEAQFKAGKCNDAQSAFWREKTAGGGDDEQTDPYEVEQSGGQAGVKEIQERLRDALHHHLIATRDTDPDRVGNAPPGGRQHDPGDGAGRSSYPVEKIVAAAELAAERDVESVPKLIELMKDSDPAIRYWGAVGCCVRKDKATRRQMRYAGCLRMNRPPCA